jgi:hypothetical protein
VAADAEMPLCCLWDKWLQSSIKVVCALQVRVSGARPIIKVAKIDIAPQRVFFYVGNCFLRGNYIHDCMIMSAA